MKNLFDNYKFIIAYVAGSFSYFLLSTVVNTMLDKQDLKIRFNIGIESTVPQAQPYDPNTAQQPQNTLFPPLQ